MWFSADEHSSEHNQKILTMLSELAQVASPLKLDRIHRLLQKNKHSAYVKNDFLDALSKLQRTVLKRRTELNDKIKHLDISFYAENLWEPNETDYWENEKYVNLKQYWACKSLLNHWEIYLWKKFNILIYF